MRVVAPDIGIDLGTSNTLICVKNKGIVLSEPTIALVSSGNEREVHAIGDDARILLGRANSGVMAIRPMREGVITDYDMTRMILQYFIQNSLGSSNLVPPRVFLSYPCIVTPIEQRVLGQAAHNAGARKVYMIEKPFLSALGCGLPLNEPVGRMVVDIGGGTTDIAVISYNGIVIDHSIRIGGVKMDEAIAEFVKQNFNILIGDRTAEEVKLDLGAALPLREERRARIRGRDMVTNLPQTAEITSTQVYSAIREPCMAILEAIKWVLERTPPEMVADIMLGGIYLTGGGSLLYGLDQLIASELGIPVLLAKEPMDCAALGLNEIINNMDLVENKGHSHILHEF